MKINASLLFATTLCLSNSVFAEEGHWEVLKSAAEYTQETHGPIDQDRYVLGLVRQVYTNYSQAHPACAYQENPDVYIYPLSFYTLTNPYMHGKNETRSMRFKIKNFVVESPGSAGNNDPACGKLSIKCAAYDKLLPQYHCERIHKGASSEPALLSDPKYNNYLAYQTIYNISVMPDAEKNFGRLKQRFPLQPFRPYSDSQIPNPDYEYNAVVFSTFDYPDPTQPPSPNYNNNNYGFLFLGSSENLQSVCHSIQYDHLSPEDAAVRFSEFFGIPPDSPDVTRKFTFFKLRNTPHVNGVADGNMFRPCPADGSIESLFCSVSALTIPHNCNRVPPPYDGTTVSSFLENQYYNVYCNTTPNRDSGVVVHYPWTGQGFTYDWYPWYANTFEKNVQGASEYIPASNCTDINNCGPSNIVVLNKRSLQEFVSTCDIS